MDYKKIYYKLINKRINERPKEVYSELHHILPKSMGGTDDKNNLVRLSAREHFMAHYLLWKTHRTKEMGYALHAMRMSNGLKKLNARRYEVLRLAFSEVNTGKLNPMYGKCGKLHHLYGRKLSDETKAKISKAQTGKKVSQETKLKLSEQCRGSKHPQYNLRGYDCFSSKEVHKYSKDGVFIKSYGGVREAARHHSNLKHTGIIACCSGRYMTSGGFVWKYVKD